MYADEQLTLLAQRKELLRSRIALRRVQTVIVASDLARPLAVVDRAVDLWRQYSPLLKMIGIPLSFVGLRQLFRRSRVPSSGPKDGKGWIGALFGALPIIIQVYQAFSSARAGAAAGSSRGSNI